MIDQGPSVTLNISEELRPAFKTGRLDGNEVRLKGRWHLAIYNELYVDENPHLYHGSFYSCFVFNS